MKSNLQILLVIVLLLTVGMACSFTANQAESNTPATATSAPVIPVPPTDTALPTPAIPTVTPTTVNNEAVALAAQTAAYGPTGFPLDVNPLTGLTVAVPANLERRPLAVKIQMFPRGGRPPWGISQADVVYDFYQNFGLTRLHAIFYSTDAEKVGPIRSARLLDIELVSMYKSIFAFGSAEQRTYTRLFNSQIANQMVVEGSANCPPMCREDPNGWNYLVTTTKDLGPYAVTRGGDNNRPNLDGMSFNAAVPANGVSQTQVYVRYSISSYTRWDFDPATSRYLRFQDIQEAPDAAGEAYEPLLDRVNNQQVAADNVVVLVAPHQYVFGTKPGPNEVVEIQLGGSGPAFAYRDGQVYELVWNRAARENLISLTFPDGSAYPLKPGITWYQVVGKSTKIDTQTPNVTRYQHAIP